jgi:3-oxoacyl-[acyl-carrier protein] reductase
VNLGLGGRKAVVVGGTRGIGRAIVETLADEGCDEGLCARDSDGVEVAAAVAFLASPRASFVSGTNLICDGARTQNVQT